MAGMSMRLPPARSPRIDSRRNARLRVEEKLELELVVDRKPRAVAQRNRGLEEPRRPDCVPTECAQVHPEALVERDSGDVVVRCNQPHPTTLPTAGLDDALLHQRPPDSPSTSTRADGNDLQLIASDMNQDDACTAATEQRHITGSWDLSVG